MRLVVDHVERAVQFRGDFGHHVEHYSRDAKTHTTTNSLSGRCTDMKKRRETSRSGLHAISTISVLDGKSDEYRKTIADRVDKGISRQT
jgi:hypothetical protein